MKRPASLDPAVHLSKAASMLQTAVDTDVTGSPEEEVGVALDDHTIKDLKMMTKRKGNWSHNSAPHPADGHTGHPADTIVLQCGDGGQVAVVTMETEKHSM